MANLLTTCFSVNGIIADAPQSKRKQLVIFIKYKTLCLQSNKLLSASTIKHRGLDIFLHTSLVTSY